MTTSPVAADETPWQFVIDHAPQVWLAEGEVYYPSSVDFALANTKPVEIDGKTWAITRDDLPDPSSILPFFHGISKDDPSWPPPVYALVLPGLDQPGHSSIEHPEASKLRVVYFTYYPYNRGKECLKTVWGNHVSDIEKCYVEFEMKAPVSIACAAHSDHPEPRPWSQVEKNGTHPIVYSAKGSHGLYFDAGSHEYKDLGVCQLVDEASQGTPWRTWENVRIVLPDQWHQLTSSAPGWEETAYFDDIYRWGNQERSCPSKVGVCRLENGPTGFLGKGEVSAILQQLDRNLGGGGWTTCTGDTASTDCPWPAGIWSQRSEPQCLPGFHYVGTLEQCFILPYTGQDCDCPSHCSAEAGTCGPAWKAHCHGNCFSGCRSDCIVSAEGNLPDGAVEHNVCDLDGQWISFVERKKQSDDSFNFNNGEGAGSQDDFRCVVPSLVPRDSPRVQGGKVDS